MHELIERLRLAAGPSVSLNRSIWCALNPGQDPTTYNGDPRWKPYTGSIDAAMTLVPAQCYARVQTATRDYTPLAWVTDEAREFSWEGAAADPAIALCIAALEASAAITGGDRAILAEDGISEAKS